MGVMMGTNYYLRRTKPVLCFPEFHVGKKSAGWFGLFEATDTNDFYFGFETQKPAITCAEDIRAAVGSGEWELVDEYGEEEDVEHFIQFMMGGWKWEQEVGKKLKDHSGGFDTYRDREGAEFTRTEFS